MLHMEVYPALPTEAASIRKEVFMEEQGFVEEFDEIDHQARHIVVEELQSEKPSVVSLWV